MTYNVFSGTLNPAQHQPHTTMTAVNYCDEYVCLSVHSHNLKTSQPNFTNFFASCPLPWFGPLMAFRYIMYFRFLRMTSYFHTVGEWAESSMTPCLEEFARWQYQLDIRQTACIVCLSSSEWGTGTKTAVYDKCKKNWLNVNVIVVNIAKFRQNPSIRCGDIAIFQDCNRCHLGV